MIHRVMATWYLGITPRNNDLGVYLTLQSH